MATFALTVHATPAQVTKPAKPAKSQPKIDDSALVSVGAAAGIDESTLFRKEAIAHQGGWTPPKGPLTIAHAKRLLRRPSGSMSLGVTSRGRLLRARKIKAKGRHYRFFPHISERQTFWGTDEMQQFITRVSTAVARKHRGAEMRIGNVSLHHGGRSPWHRSHQVGRDVDICFYARDRQGKPVKMDNFRKFRRTGFSRDGQLVFDDARNLDVALAMLAQTETPVQWVFVARWLKRRMLKVAEKRGLPEETMTQLSQLLRQPGDSAPHDDHFHVRLFCSLQDRKYGCLDRGPKRAWVDRFEDAFGAHVERLVEASALSSDGVRLKAVKLLTRIEARDAGPAFVARLADSNAKVQQAALGAIVGLRPTETAPGVLAACGQATKGAWAAQLFDAWVGLGAEQLQDTACTVLQHPDRVLHARVVKSKALQEIQLRAIAALAERGRQSDVPTLIGVLNSRSKKLRLAAHEALVFLTNQPIRSRYLLSKSRKNHKKTIAAWRKFWRRSQAKTWLSWMKAGFRGNGVRLARGTQFVRRDVPRLIRALTSRKEHVAHNAAKVLVQITGHKPWVRRRTKRSLRRHWSYWWRKRGRRVTLRG
ncbi:MAG: penicillin-insensitive murein endopeptidase [Myxococcales bacterium]|nr:penicillin-insensitive murein endopeptidase [Myxococcales bacterium]